MDIDALGGMQSISIPYFINLFNSIIMNLRNLLVFITIGEVAQCTKLLISRVHDRILWLDKKYLIHVEDIHQFTKLSLKGEDISKVFQVPRKHVKKKGEVNMYQKFHTQRGRCMTKSTQSY